MATDPSLTPVLGKVEGAGSGYVIDRPGSLIAVNAGADGADIRYEYPLMETVGAFELVKEGGAPRLIFVAEDKNFGGLPTLYFYDGATYFALTMTPLVPME